jgi:hypothetical protein
MDGRGLNMSRRGLRGKNGIRGMEGDRMGIEGE